MNTSTELHELAPALAIAQGQIRAAIKESVNPHYRSRYADLSAVWDACRAALSANGLSVVQMPTDADEGRVGLTTMLLHASGQYISGTVSTRLQKDDAQGVGSALTYLRRYALAAMVGVVADEDDDGNAAIAPTQQRPQAAPSKLTPSPAPHAPGAVIKGAVYDVRVVKKDDGTVTARFSVDGVQYIAAKRDAEYLKLQDGDLLTFDAGKAGRDGAVFVNSITDWEVPF